MLQLLHLYSVQLRFYCSNRFNALRFRDDVSHLAKLGRFFSHRSNNAVLVVEKPNERESDDETYRLKKIVLLATLSNESFAKLTAALLGPTKKVRCFSSCNLF